MPIKKELALSYAGELAREPTLTLELDHLKELAAWVQHKAGSAGPFSIGSKVWPGLGKLVEECGEACQVAGKLMGTGGDTKHWDGGEDLKIRLEEEVGDILAAISFLIDNNQLNREAIKKRREKKLETFTKWHKEQGDG